MGKPLLGDTFDPNEVMCVKVQLYIVHNVDPKTGRTYANIAKVKRCEVQDVDPADLENEVSVVEALDKDLTGVN